jgi:hypothetical protein
VSAVFKLHFDRKDHIGTNRLEEVFHSPFCCELTLDHRFRKVPDREAECGNKVVIYLRVKVKLVGDQRSGLRSQEKGIGILLLPFDDQAEAHIVAA